MICEFCNHQEENTNGYDDRYYHDNVIPEMTCKQCHKSTKSEGGEIAYTQTRYPEGFQI